ncbi:MAG TPA: hypothetical protein V6C57_28715 [Coleofasciculaceae cyanobacterium]
MAEQPMIKCHIPQAWQAEIQAIANQAGCSAEQIIYEAIAQYLGKGNQHSHLAAHNVAEEQKRLEQRLADMEHRSLKADAALMQVMTLSTRVAALEQAQLLQRIKTEVPTVGVEDVGVEEDAEDEPDEILTSFLESDDFQERASQSVSLPRVLKHQSLPLTYEDFEDEADEILYDFIEP